MSTDDAFVGEDDIDILLANWRKETKSKRGPPEDQEPSAAQLSVFSMYNGIKKPIISTLAALDQAETV